MNEVHTLNRSRRFGNEDFEEIELPIHIIRGGKYERKDEKSVSFSTN